MSKSSMAAQIKQGARKRERDLGEVAQEIFLAGVDAVRAEQLVRDAVHLDGHYLKIGKLIVDLRKYQRLLIVGAGKASGYMAHALLEALGTEIPQKKKLTGWVNVPEGGDLSSLEGITLFPARPAGENLPTHNVVIGTQRIREMIGSMRKSDLALCLISGGGSALLAQPVPGVSLEDKRRVSQLLSQRRADIAQLNRVRRQISLVKGGRLAAERRQGRLISLIISDVLGDPIEFIASGPTAVSPDDPAGALAVFEELNIPEQAIPASVLRHLRAEAAKPITPIKDDASADVQNVIVGNLHVAVQAAARHAQQLGYQVKSSIQSDRRETVDEAAQWLAAQLRDAPEGRHCLIYGGEPVIDVGTNPGKGGRNQHLALQTLNLLLRDWHAANQWPPSYCLLAGGTDGEDGNTEMAGAWFDASRAAAIQSQGVNLALYLDAYNAFDFFARHGGHVDLGPTHTNVGDLRILLTHRAVP